MQLTRFMAPDTDSLKPDPPQAGGKDWSRRRSLTSRILVVNIVPLALLAGSFFFLDGFRDRLISERLIQANNEARLIAQAIGREDEGGLAQLIDRMGKGDKVRIRVTDASGTVIADNWLNGRSFELRDPASERWQRKVAFRIDEAIDWLVGAEIPRLFIAYEGALPPMPDGAHLSLAPDRTHMVEAQAVVPSIAGHKVVTLRNARDIRRFVRAERTNLAYMLALISGLSILLSLFLARTIVGPLRSLAEAAQAVRFGQAREVQIPLLPSRDDDIGQLARAMSDMTHALRTRMDAVEAFAADVAHELKNPLASLASALQSLRGVKKAEHKAQLEEIVEGDIRRLDRLITDISDLSRVDAHMARTRFQRFDAGVIVQALVHSWTERKTAKKIKISFNASEKEKLTLRGDADQLSRAIDNLIGNALSFSPDQGTILVSARKESGQIILTVEDEGPGIPASARNSIFERFHSDRPAEEFGQYSGLGLSIAKTIVEAHGGTIKVQDRPDSARGACFVISLPSVRR
jgi:two-component system, OmpR family, sensor histidine kinase ChvG